MELKKYLCSMIKVLVLTIILGIAEVSIIYFLQTKITRLDGVWINNGHLLLLSYLNMVLSFLIIERYNKSNLSLHSEE
jgi:hypothetical protein